MKLGFALVAAAFAGLHFAEAKAEAVQLASLSSIEGKVLVNKGKGFVSARPQTALAEGDRVIALHASRAAVTYPDGCVTPVPENSMLILGKTATCGKDAQKAAAQRQPPLRFAQAIGAPVTDAGGSAGRAAPLPAPEPRPTLQLAQSLQDDRDQRPQQSDGECLQYDQAAASGEVRCAYTVAQRERLPVLLGGTALLATGLNYYWKKSNSDNWPISGF